MRLLLLATVMIVFFVAVDFSIDAKSDDRAPASADPVVRKKSLDFEDEVVEGMNKNPLDSLENVAQNDRDGDGHLYRKRKQFKKEIHDVVHEAGYMP